MSLAATHTRRMLICLLGDTTTILMDVSCTQISVRHLLQQKLFPPKFLTRGQRTIYKMAIHVLTTLISKQRTHFSALSELISVLRNNQSCYAKESLEDLTLVSMTPSSLLTETTQAT